MGGILVGIVTSRDIDFAHEPDMSRPIKEVRIKQPFPLGTINYLNFITLR